MQVLLNIGLESKTLGKIAPVTAISAARLSGFDVVGAKLVQSDTEPTLVLAVEINECRVSISREVSKLAVELGQDCIAVWRPEFGNGALVGPRAAEWGPFNPEFFFLLDGTRLQAPAAKAA